MTVTRTSQTGTATYRYPRTLVEMATMRAADLASSPPAASGLPAERPRCEAHGPKTLRPLGRQTYEQAFCGVWYDCEQCGASSLYPSRDLQHQLGEPYFDGSFWQRWDGERWTHMAAAEAEEFYRRKQEDLSGQLAGQRKPKRRMSAAHRHARSTA
jgi:hypothetical protein